MAVPKELASQVFAQNTELDERIENSTAYYGGEDVNKEAASMSEEQVALAKEVYGRHYLSLKKKFEQNPDSMTADELVAAELYQKIESGEELTPKEQSKLYLVLRELDGTDLSKLSKKDKKEFLQRFGFGDESQAEKFLEKVHLLRREVFFNLTGYPDRLTPPNRSQFDSKEEYKKALEEFRKAKASIVEGALDERYKDSKHLVSIRRGIRKFKWGYLPQEFNRRIWGKDANGLDAEEMVEMHRRRMYELHKGEFKPERDLILAREAGLQKVRDEILKAGRMVDDADAIKMVSRARSYRALRKAAEKIVGPDAFAEGGDLEGKDPETIVAETIAENLWAQDMDEIARRALVRELPEKPAELRATKKEYQQIIAQKRAELKRTKDKTKRAKLAKEIDSYSQKIQIIDTLLSTGKEKGKMPSLMRSKDTPKVERLERVVPPSMSSEMLRFMAAELGIDYDGRSDDDLRKEVNSQIESMTIFGVIALLLRFFSEKI